MKHWCDTHTHKKKNKHICAQAVGPLHWESWKKLQQQAMLLSVQLCTRNRLDLSIRWTHPLKRPRQETDNQDVHTQTCLPGDLSLSLLRLLLRDTMRTYTMSNKPRMDVDNSPLQSDPEENAEPQAISILSSPLCCQLIHSRASKLTYIEHYRTAKNLIV